MFRIFRKIRERVFTENKFSKYIFYSLGEIILVVIGILIALQVDNWNSERLNQQDLKKYAKSLVQDLQNDIHMLNVSRRQAKNSFHDIEQLRNYFSSTPAEKYSNTHLYVLVGNSLLYRPYKWNRSTLDEIKNSGYLRYIKNNILEEKLIAYETFSYHLDEDFEGDKDRSNLASEILSEMLDLNSPYFAQLDSVRKIHYKNPDFDIFQ
ncbi:MAG: DUF6090 family protein, partial [Cyclobacteriaceae bacterium]|nr:DUF6090 family protein [Cyclobacteriaceae bacterium]